MRRLVLITLRGQEVRGGGDAVTMDWTLNSSRCTMRTSEDLGEWVK